MSLFELEFIEAFSRNFLTEVLLIPMLLGLCVSVLLEYLLLVPRVCVSLIRRPRCLCNTRPQLDYFFSGLFAVISTSLVCGPPYDLISVACIGG